MKLIVGLGNPGREYQATRHNIGFAIVDVLARRHHIRFRSVRNKALSGEGIICGENVVLVKPMTYMNLSGQAVEAFVRRNHLDLSDLLVICDDVNLPLGKLRIRPKGSAGGHNGLKSIIHSLESQDFARLRVGIGSPREKMTDHVLSRFNRREMGIVKETVEKTADVVETLLKDGIEQAMNCFNS